MSGRGRSDERIQLSKLYVLMMPDTWKTYTEQTHNRMAKLRPLYLSKSGHPGFVRRILWLSSRLVRLHTLHTHFRVAIRSMRAEAACIEISTSQLVC